MAMDKPWLDGWVDDDGSGITGTVWNKARITEMANAFDATTHGAQQSNPATVAIGAGRQTPALGTPDFNEGGYQTGFGTLVVPPGKGGIYLVYATVMWDGTLTGAVRGLQILQNGAALVMGFTDPISIAGAGPCVTLLGGTLAAAGVTFNVTCYSDVATTILPGARFGLVRV